VNKLGWHLPHLYYSTSLWYCYSCCNVRNPQRLFSKMAASAPRKLLTLETS